MRFDCSSPEEIKKELRLIWITLALIWMWIVVIIIGVRML